MNIKIILLFLLACTGNYVAQAQQTALEYNNAIVHQLNSVTLATATYMDAAAHGHNAADANAKLAILVKTLKEAKNNVAAMQAYKGYSGLRDSISAYLNLATTAATGFSGVLGEEEMMAMPFEKIKAYMDGCDALNDRLNSYGELVKREQKRFAAKNGFAIEEEQKPLDKKFEQANKVLNYYHKIFFVFIKSNKLEVTFIDSLNSNNPRTVEQIRKLLLQNTEDGLKKLEAFAPYNNDAGLINASKDGLQFFEMEAKDKFPFIVDYYQKKEKFDRQKEALDKVAEKDRTDKMIDSYNANLNALNAAVDSFNKTNQELNAKRIEVINTYNAAINDFLDRNIPKMK